MRKWNEILRNLIYCRNNCVVHNIFFGFKFFDYFIMRIYIFRKIIEQKLSIGDFTYLLGIFNGLKDDILNLVADLAKLEESNLAIKNYKCKF